MLLATPLTHAQARAEAWRDARATSAILRQGGAKVQDVWRYLTDLAPPPQLGWEMVTRLIVVLVLAELIRGEK